MKRFRNGLFYIGIIGSSSALMYWTVLAGSRLEQGRDILVPDTGKSEWQNFTDSLIHQIQHPLALLLAQIMTIIVTARLLGWVCKKMGQPTVIGEIIAGIVLGPSLVGHYFPEFSLALFPASSLGNLQFLSQIGLIFFMFVVGMELDLQALKNKAKEAVVISHASIIIPFALGMGLAYFIYESFAPENVQFLSFALFLGIAMSITAFPVLARIVQERELYKTRLGTIVITCAAADDITAWCLLAAVCAIVKAGSFLSSLYIIALALIYVLLMLKVVRPFLRRVGDLHATREKLSKPIVAIFFLTLILSSFATEIIGIHALFGAFLAGSIMPENTRFRNLFIEKVEDIALVLLLPLFFVFTGLRTEIGLLNDPALWKLTGWIILVAVAGKFLGSALTARFVGQNWKDSLTIGALMNTRGLMELVVLNIGYDLGVLTPEIFAMMVIMALATTFMTGPALDIINWWFRSRTSAPSTQQGAAGTYRILISFGNPENGIALLRLAGCLTRKWSERVEVTAMHLISSGELHHYNADEYEKESFGPILKESNRLNQPIHPLFKASNDIDSDITDVANKGNFDLLLIGAGKSIYEGSLLGRILGFTTRMINPETLINQVSGKENLFEPSPFDDRTRSILVRSDIAVGILVDKGFEKADRVVLILLHEKDIFLLRFAHKLIKSSASRITVLDPNGLLKIHSEMVQSLQSFVQLTPDHLNCKDTSAVDTDDLLHGDLLLMSAEGWKQSITAETSWLRDIPSTLILADRISRGHA